MLKCDLHSDKNMRINLRRILDTAKKSHILMVKHIHMMALFADFSSWAVSAVVEENAGCLVSRDESARRD